jgi:hypothetical protein
MARIELGPIVQSVRGSIGGVTFRKIGPRFYASPKSQGPVSPGRTSADHHRRLKDATAAWGNLDASVKEFWSRYHALEHPRHPRSGATFISAYNLFTCYQLMRLHCGAEMLTATIPEPPIFSTSTIYWSGPFTTAGEPYNGVMYVNRAGGLQTDYCCLLITPTPDGEKPGKFPKICFPAYGYGPGRVVQDSNWLIYRALGYPPGLDGITTQEAPASPLYLMGGWGLHDDVIYSCPWTLPELRGTTFVYPIPTPTVLT